MAEEGRALTETPTWAVATVVTIIITLGWVINGSLELFGKWLDRTKRKPLLAALDKIKDELMVFGLLSLLMGHWIETVAKICVKSSVFGSKFYPCVREDQIRAVVKKVTLPGNSSFSVSRKVLESGIHDYCSEGYESFASYESLEQLHHLLFTLGVTHISYSFLAIALAMTKIYSWGTWEKEAKSMASQISEGYTNPVHNVKVKKVSSFILHHASHRWSHHEVLAWLLCFSRQFWSSINESDYIALRYGFITTHELPLSYDFHKYMLRSMEEEFCDIVGISVPLWAYAIISVILDYHGSSIYFWLSFLPAILVLMLGTKLHHIVLKLAIEILDTCPWRGNRLFKLRDDFFWCGDPRLLLRLIQFISFQNATEMAMFLWSLWEIKDASCFMKNSSFIVIRLTFGIMSQFWCSFSIFPLYVIIAQMGSRFKQTLVSESVRKSLHGWQNRVKCGRTLSSRASPSSSSSTSSITSSSRRPLIPLVERVGKLYTVASTSNRSSSVSDFGNAAVIGYEHLAIPISAADKETMVDLSSDDDGFSSSRKNSDVMW